LLAFFWFLLITHTFSGCGEVTKGPARQIYIAPDLGTYLYAISLWDADKIFPVFMDRNDRYTKKFADAYADGGEIEYIELPKHKVGRVNEELVYKTLYAAWGPETLEDFKKRKIGREDIKKRFTELNHVPEGIVITNIKDAEFAGGLALAAGHKQILAFYEPKYKFNFYPKKSKTPIPWHEKENIRDDIIGCIDGWGYPYKGLGEGIDYITLALDITHTYNPLDPKGKHQQLFSLDDAINRLKPDGVRSSFLIYGTDKRIGFWNVFAYTGRLLEATKHMALYQAMCSLFIPVRKALFYDRWKSEWRMECRAGAWIMRSNVYTFSTIRGWSHWMGDFNTWDFVRMNSAGGAYDWGKRSVDEFVDSTPCIVYFAHSGSARYPGDVDSICGRWLFNGAYIYYGSISEPYAHAFNAPDNMARGMVAGMPLARAFQRKETLPPVVTGPWKLIYIGDPLKVVEFADNPEEDANSKNYRQAIGLLRQRKLAQATELLEKTFAGNKDKKLDAAIRETLMDTYRLVFLLGDVSPDKLQQLPPYFIDHWYTRNPGYSDAPDAAVMLYEKIDAEKQGFHRFLKEISARKGLESKVVKLINSQIQ